MIKNASFYVFGNLFQEGEEILINANKKILFIIIINMTLLKICLEMKTKKDEIKPTDFGVLFAFF